ncbi:MAG TPA: methyltransferase domain-containing protein [Actinomycetota bacterium]
MTFETGTDWYARHVGRYTDALAAALIDGAAIRDGDRALDVGCGPGAALAALARRLGPDRVAGVDPSEPFVLMARERVPGADVRLGAGQALPFEDGSFDVVLSQLVVNFMTDAAAGVAEMRRVGRRSVVSCVWDYAGEMTMLRVFWDAALELDPDAPDEGRVMRWCSPIELEDLWTWAGLSEVEVDELVVSAGYADFDDYWLPFTAGIAPSGAYCASLAPESREALREACRRRLAVPDGPFELRARAWVVRGWVDGE